MCPQWPEPENLFKPILTHSRNRHCAHTLSLGELWCELQILLFSAVWALLYEQPSVGMVAPCYEKDKTNKPARKTRRSAPRCTELTATSVGLGRFSFPWDFADGSFIRLCVKVTVGSQCFPYSAGIWQLDQQGHSGIAVKWYYRKFSQVCFVSFNQNIWWFYSGFWWLKFQPVITQR